MSAMRLIVALWLSLAFVPRGGDPRYLKDFEFIVEAVKKESAALATKGINWDAVVKKFRLKFEQCTDDGEHVRNVMELFATLRDSHTGVLDTKVKAGLPEKFDGLYGAGIWFGWDQGKAVIRGVTWSSTVGG